jgi:hypothetical protein
MDRIAVICLLYAMPAQAGFENTEWGMTPEQVEAAMSGKAKLSKGSKGKELEGKRIGNAGTYEVDEIEFSSTYYYDDRGLAQVSLDAEFKQCTEVVRSVMAKHGQPKKVSDQIILRLIIWHDEANSNRLRLLYSQAGICNLNYERLDDYKDVDNTSG